MVLENELTFTARVDRSYDEQFAVTGAKIGVGFGMGLSTENGLVRIYFSHAESNHLAIQSM